MGDDMDYNSDKPIEKFEDDLLGRATFSKQLGKTIYEYSVTDGLVIGLYGKWGTGKTSVMNLALQEIKELSTDDESELIVFKFSPWNFSDKDNLISIYFKCLKDEISKHKMQVNWQVVGEALNNYSDMFDAISFVPIPGMPILSAILKKQAKVQGQKLAQGESLDGMKKKLEKALIDGGQKIIVVIDDIDRLTNAQIRDIFQLVKQVANFPNVIYIMAMDRDVVSHALDEVNGGNGADYLEKIVQVSFEIPELRKSRLYDVFSTKIDSIVSSMPNEVMWDRQYSVEVFQNCIAPYLKSMRDVNRIVNTFRLRCSLLYQETSLEDLVAVTTLEVLEPKLYKWISQNKEAVCGGFSHSLMFGTSGDKTDYYINKYKREFANIGIDVERAFECLSTLFPVFAKDVNKNTWGYQPSPDVRSAMRVAQENRFDLYFISDLEDVKVPRSIINTCLYDLSLEEIEKTISIINEQNNIIYFLEEMGALVESIPHERLSIIVLALLSGETRLIGESRNDIFSASAMEYCYHLVNKILKCLESENERANVLEIALKNVKKHGLYTLAQIINSIELAYGRLSAETERHEEQIVTLPQLEDLEKLYIKRIEELTKDDLLFGIDGYGVVFYLWKCLDVDSAKKYMNEVLEDDIATLKFICAMAGQWNGTTGRGWSFHSKNYSEYLTGDEIYSKIQKIDVDMLGRFSEEEQIKLASFFLNYKKNQTDHDVNEDKARELVEQWKNNK